MDVRCERCRAEYAIADEDVGDEGLAVRCAGCGHVFRVKRKAFVVTVPLKPDELRQVAPVSTAELDRRRRDAEALAGARAGEGPVVAGELAQVDEDRWEAPRAGRSGGDEPAWAEGRGRAPAVPDRPEPQRKAQRRSVWPGLLVVVLVLAAGAAVVVLRPEWVGLGPVVPPKSSSGGGAVGGQTGGSAKSGQSSTGNETPTSNPTSTRTASPTANASPTASPTATASPTPTPAASASPPPPTADGTASSSPISNPTPAASPTPAPAPQSAATGGGAERSAPAPVAAAPAAPARPTSPPPPRRTALARPSGPKALVADGQRLRERGRPQEALDVYARALAVAPDDADALAGRGLCYLDLSQYRPAESSFEEALRADAQHPDALMGLAETYRYEGRRADAVTYYQRYLTAHPRGRDAAAARSAIDALKE